MFTIKFNDEAYDSATKVIQTLKDYVVHVTWAGGFEEDISIVDYDGNDLTYKRFGDDLSPRNELHSVHYTLIGSLKVL